MAAVRRHCAVRIDADAETGQEEQWKFRGRDVTPSVLYATDVHCLRCGALPDEPCRQSDGKSVPPHPERQEAYRGRT